MKQKVAFLTLGCKVNAYETQAMERLFVNAGYELVDFYEKADIYIINTCTVTNIADRKSRQMLRRARKNNREAVVVAVGCYVQAVNTSEELGVDILIGNNQKAEVLSLVEAFLKEPKKRERVLKEEENWQYEPLSIDTITEKTRAYIKIQDGCNQFCSYCIIPYVRGRIRSRKKEDVLAEIKGLAAKGYEEVVLTGIHLSSYGIDEDKTCHLLPLIEEIQKIEKISRIRLGSLEPRIMTKAFIEELKQFDKVCPHFHLSLQSGCDETLKRMNRHYTTADYERACNLLREAYPNPALTTDIICGFPKETQQEFEETYRFVETIGFSKIHIFPYSRRKGTHAEKMEGQVEEKIKKERTEKLSLLEKKMAEAYRSLFYGKREEVLFEEEIEMDNNWYQIGHTTRYLRVATPQEKGTNWSGKRIKVDNLEPLKEDILKGLTFF